MAKQFMAIEVGLLHRKAVRRYFAKANAVEGVEVQAQESKGLLSSVFHVEVTGRPDLVEIVRQTVTVDIIEAANRP